MAIKSIYVKNSGAWGEFVPTDAKVTQTLNDSTNSTYPLLLTDVADKSATSTSTSNFSTKIKFNPSTSTLTVANVTVSGTLTASTIVSSQPLSLETINATTVTATGALKGASLTLTTTPLAITSGGTGISTAPTVGQILRCVTAGSLSWVAFPITDSYTTSNSALALSAAGGYNLNTSIGTLRSDLTSNVATINTTIAALPTKDWVNTQIASNQTTAIAAITYFIQSNTAPTTDDEKKKLWVDTSNNTVNYWNTTTNAWIGIVGTYLQ